MPLSTLYNQTPFDYLKVDRRNFSVDASRSLLNSIINAFKRGGFKGH